MKIISNFPALKEYPQIPVNISLLSAAKILRRFDRIIINIDQALLFKFCFVKLCLPFLPGEIISIDLLLRTPKKTFVVQAKFLLSKILWKKISLFILYFKNTNGYQKLLGIDPKKIRYAPFKVNSWEKIKDKNKNHTEKTYVLCAGRTMRDLATFSKAMEMNPSIPAIVLLQSNEVMKSHGTNTGAISWPKNITIKEHSDGLESTFLATIEKASLLIIPRFKQDIASTGISTMLCAMGLKTPVIISSGPGTEDILPKGAAEIVAPEDPVALASAITSLWTNTEGREQLSTTAYQYASLLEGDARLLRDILKEVQSL